MIYLVNTPFSKLADVVCNISGLLCCWTKNVRNPQRNAMGYIRKSPTYAAREAFIGKALPLLMGE